MTYIPPTDEEIASVLTYWSQVQNSVFLGKDVTNGDISLELLKRVGEYQERQSALICTHPEMSWGGGWNSDGPTCTHCGRPVQFMSDIQIEELKSEHQS